MALADRVVARGDERLGPDGRVPARGAARRRDGRADEGDAGDREAARPSGRLKIEVDAGDQIFITGINGSGKTRLAVAIANRFDNFVIYEPKGDDPEVIGMPNTVRAWGVDAALKAIPGRVIYHPTVAEMSNLAAAFDRLVQRCIQLGGRCAIVVMETCDVGDASRGFAMWLSLACRQGRGKLILRIFVTQRPVADVPRLAISEAKHFVAFYLQDARDRKTLTAYMGEGVAEQTEFNHDYWYCGKSSGMRPVRMAAL